MLSEIKKYQLANGRTIGERLETEYPDGNWYCNKDELNFIYRVAGIKHTYRWGYNGGNLVALSASANRLTPELNINHTFYKQQRELADEKDLAIYDYFNNLFAEGYCEEECASLTAKKFGLELSEVHIKVNQVSAILFL